MTIEQMLMRPADEAYTMLLYDFEVAEYEKRYRNVQQENQIMQNALRK